MLRHGRTNCRSSRRNLHIRRISCAVKSPNSMDDASSPSSNGETPERPPRKKIDGSKHPYVPKAIQLSMRKNADGSWGPTGLYGGRIKETKLLSALRDVIKPSRLKRIEEVLAARSSRVQCLFENLNDPGNGAACLRTMEAFGLLKAHAVEAYGPFKVSGGITVNADKWMVVSKYHHCMDAATALKEQGFTLIATCLDDNAIPITEVDYRSMDRLCIMFGNEDRGLSLALRDVADKKVYIPMSGFSQSLNISVSCAIMLFHLRECGMITPDLSEDEMGELYLKWLLMSTKKSPMILKKHKFEQLAPDFM